MRSIIITILILGLTYAVEDKGTSVNQGFSLARTEQISAALTIPKSMNFQGYLYQDGTMVNDTMNIWFGIFNTPTTGYLLYQQTKLNVEVINGWFSVTLTNIPDTVFRIEGPIRYLEIKAPPAGPAMEPRIPLTSVGYSFHSNSSDTAEYARVSQILRPIDPPISGAEIAKPCTLEASVDNPGPLLVLSNPTGIALEIIQAGSSGIRIDTAANNGIQINNCGINGVRIVNAPEKGISIGNAGLDGIEIGDCGNNGIRIDAAVEKGLSIGNANMGVYINSASGNGVRVQNAGTIGYSVGQAESVGVKIGKAGTYGVQIDSAQYGLYVQTASIGAKVNNVNYGLRVDTVGNCGVVVNNSSGDGVRVYDIDGNGFEVIGGCGENGLRVSDCAGDGVRIEQAGSDGLYIDHCYANGILVDAAGNDGIHVRFCDGDGIEIDSTDELGLLVNEARIGVRVDHASEVGVFVSNTDNYGVVSWGDSAGGNFYAAQGTSVWPNSGIFAHSYYNDPDKYAIYAEGHCYATGGWAGYLKGEKDGGPCIMSLERTIIVYGTAKLSSGKAEIKYPETFTENIRSDMPISLSITPSDDPTGVLFTKKNGISGFSVTLKEIPGWSGDSDVNFDWIAIGTLQKPEYTPEAKANWENAMRQREKQRAGNEKIMNEGKNKEIERK